MVKAFAGAAVCLAALLAAPAMAGTIGAELAGQAGMEVYPVPLKAPALKLPGLDGEVREARHYRGKVVLLNFWASWCPPCREEFPSLERLQRALGGRDFTVLAVSVADSAAGVARFLGGRQPPFEILMDDDRHAAQAWRAAGVPVTYLLDRQGRILAGRTGPQHWDSGEMQQLIRRAMAE